VVNSQPARPALPYKEFYQLASPVAGFPTFMDSGGTVKGLPTIVIVP
jgi:hypothetical protein